jgi:hypothetical protein
MLAQFERITDTVIDNVDTLCENIIVFSPRLVEVGNDLERDTAMRIVELLEISYPARFDFYVNDDIENDGQFAIFAKYA